MSNDKSAYDQAREVERRGIELISPFLDRASDRWQLMQGNPQMKRLQKECGDIFLTLSDGRAPFVEVKVEERYTGRLVYEDWSNARFLKDAMGHAEQGSNPGWATTIRAEILAYVFLDVRKVVFIKTTDLLKFVNNEETASLVSQPKQQRKRLQPNVTIIRLVKMNDFRRFYPLYLFKIDQGELFQETYEAAFYPEADEKGLPWRR